MRILNGLLLAALLCWSNCAQADVFSWADYGLDIADVQGGDSFLFRDVDGSGIDFEFSFEESFGRGSTLDQLIINPTNPEGNATYYTGNGNVESLYANDPLYLIGESSNRRDAITLTIKASRPISLIDMLVGDIDRYDGGSFNGLDSFRDSVRFQPSLRGTNVDPIITTDSSTLTINGKTVRATTNALLDSSNINSQVNVSAEAIDEIRITYRNIDRDGLSNSHLIVFGNDERFFSFVPEPSSAMILGLLVPALSLRRRKI